MSGQITTEQRINVPNTVVCQHTLLHRPQQPSESNQRPGNTLLCCHRHSYILHHIRKHYCGPTYPLALTAAVNGLKIKPRKCPVVLPCTNRYSLSHTLHYPNPMWVWDDSLLKYITLFVLQSIVVILEARTYASSACCRSQGNEHVCLPLARMHTASPTENALAACCKQSVVNSLLCTLQKPSETETCN